MDMKSQYNKKIMIQSVVAGVIVVGALAGSGIWFHTRQVEAAKSAAAAAQTATKYQQIMALTRIDNPTVQAPDFQLEDQYGKKTSLSDLKGKNIVIEFMDPKCTDICPIVSQEFIQANRFLGENAKDVEFLGVNVNQYFEAPSDVFAFSKEQGLIQLQNWHFLTGTTPELKQVWANYGVQVIPNPSGDVKHSSFVFFIDQNGTERYLAHPLDEKSTITEWAHGIAYVVNQMASSPQSK